METEKTPHPCFNDFIKTLTGFDKDIYDIATMSAGEWGIMYWEGKITYLMPKTPEAYKASDEPFDEEQFEIDLERLKKEQPDTGAENGRKVHEIAEKVRNGIFSIL